MRYLILLVTAASIATIKSSPIDDLRKQITNLTTDLQALTNTNKDLQKKLQQLEDQLKESNHNDGLSKRVEKLEKQVHKLKSRLNNLEAASEAELSVLPYLTRTVSGITVTLTQQEFTRLVSLIPLQSISPNITVNGATYTVELSNILNALTVKMLNILS